MRDFVNSAKHDPLFYKDTESVTLDEMLSFPYISSPWRYYLLTTTDQRYLDILNFSQPIANYYQRRGTFRSAKGFAEGAADVERRLGLHFRQRLAAHGGTAKGDDAAGDRIAGLHPIGREQRSRCAHGGQLIILIRFLLINFHTPTENESIFLPVFTAKTR